jgi:hypothetical protein
MSEFDKLVKTTIKFTIIKNALSLGWTVINNHNDIVLKKQLHYLNDADRDFSILLSNLLQQIF